MDVEFCQVLYCHIEMVIWFLFLMLLMWYIPWIDLQMSKYCKSGIKPAWSGCLILLMYCWIVCNILLRYFASIFISNIGLWFFFSGGLLFLFCYQDNAGLLKCVWECSPIFCPLEELEKDWYSSLNVCESHQWRHLVLEFCFWVGFWLLIQSP